jgi:hypothetical protein
MPTGSGRHGARVAFFRVAERDNPQARLWGFVKPVQEPNAFEPRKVLQTFRVALEDLDGGRFFVRVDGLNGHILRPSKMRVDDADRVQ